ncbi:hypothetical protein TcWFU_003018 [Taenia crassiceps]|uniref:Uncharacterized protein n=1 Tax=Taenia crassiceps TaxID=6207 RepID=A0ABR4QRG1_9CEST
MMGVIDEHSDDGTNSSKTIVLCLQTISSMRCLLSSRLSHPHGFDCRAAIRHHLPHLPKSASSDLIADLRLAISYLMTFYNKPKRVCETTTLKSSLKTG